MVRHAQRLPRGATIHQEGRFPRDLVRRPRDKALPSRRPGWVSPAGLWKPHIPILMYMCVTVYLFCCNGNTAVVLVSSAGVWKPQVYPVIHVYVRVTVCFCCNDILLFNCSMFFEGYTCGGFNRYYYY